MRSSTSVSENNLNMLDLVWTWSYYLALFLLPIMLYCLVRTRTKSRYSNRDWFYLIKYLYAKRAVQKFQDKCARTAKEITSEDLEKVKKVRSDKYRDHHYIYGLDQIGNSLSLKITIRANLVAEVYLVLRLADGATYTLPDEARLCSISKWQWQAGGVRIDVLEPLKRLRITHNGMLLLRSTTEAHDATKDGLQHVRFNFIFNSTGLPSYYPQDASTNSLADSIASETWRDGRWMNLLGDERGYEQFGALHGSVRSETFDEDLILNLPACRTRFWGANENLSLKRSVRLFVVASDGTGINVWIKSLKKGCQSINHGNVLFNTGNMSTIDDCDFRLQFVAQHGSIPSVFTVNVKAKNKDFSCVFHIKDSLRTVSSEVRGYKVIESQAECDFNSIQGKATVEFWYSQVGPGCELPAPLISSGLNKQNDEESKASYVIGFKDASAKFVNLTGGKGSSLAMLTSIQSQDFKVPDGVVVTTKSFQEHCEQSFNLKKALSILEDLCFGKTAGDLKAACEEVAILFRNEKLSEALAEEIIKSTSDGKKYAVRSSGVSEDTEELSAAGQNDTFLGVSGRNQILESVSKCWASLFSYQSVKYRHQHGLPIKSRMAVVIQEMVASQAAGVLFTCHPSTGNPAEILITANYGLGESVVSGKSEPDTIVVHRYAGTLTKTLGSKETVIRMSEHQNETEEVSNGNRDMCVTDAQCAALAKVAVVIETAFGDARDIEWAFDQAGQLHLLQSRPITTLQSWTDAELLHEFDTPTFTDDVVFTVANTGEVFPGSQSTLTLSSVCQVIDTSIQSTVLLKPDPSAMKCLSIFQNHVFIDVVNGMHRNAMKDIQMASKLLDLAIFGHPVINETINNIAIQRFGIKTRIDMQKESWNMMKRAWRNQKNLAEMTKGAHDLDDEIGSKDTAEEMYQKIERLMPKLHDVFRHHVPITGTSVFYQMVEMSILVGSSQEITPEHYNDIALILSSNDDVISAEIPTTLERIAKALQNKRTEFLQIDPKDGVAWLKANCPEASETLDKFLHDHGHRVLGEFDIYKKTWGLDPSQIIKMIQTNCAVATANKRPVEKPEIDAIIADLKSPKNNFTRKILRFLLKRSRKAVGARELSKCEAVRAIHKFRLAYRKLAAKMADEGLIPSADLIFHLSHYEIKQIVVHKTKRTPQLIQKAWRRQRLHPTWDKLKFPELNYGLPMAENDSGDHRAGCGSDVRLEGTPVCSGTVKARACVITGLDEIDQLHHGDILITYCTDIGWSPYFPMLAGIVTELGGLVSHGAVVAREYGLPSIVGVKSATRVFKTGDTVLLSGKTGTIELVM